ncbi:GNAT family N-acetyltransferase [Nesterenkonia sp. MY13]|uniref:GNAT family N-acetyltransferase n=1 Tax=Nesterenkonia sedimenti TaxID=1463632 RepID=A0A7X8TIV3_9MICC|nr:GNAT family protein [Nesterenkonia sedimenti]NLS09361.1 GNAT family N-acetyltransferase [Nesterenkonia sedimenti]
MGAVARSPGHPVVRSKGKVPVVSSNEFGQPVGDPVPDWTPRPLPSATRLPGHWCALERLDSSRHVQDLYDAYAQAPDGRNWTYLGVGPFLSASAYREWAEQAAQSEDPRHYAVIEQSTNKAVGTLSLMRHDPNNGVIEVGWVNYSPALQRTPASTEAQYLLMHHVFEDLGYRRYEWKCDSLNEPSRRAAERLGFTYEGTFRQAVVTKGRNRDTAWYSILDSEWPELRTRFDAWLSASNFTSDHRQIQSLSSV